jgi:hypothetical protein
MDVPELRKWILEEKEPQVPLDAKQLADAENRINYLHPMQHKNPRLVLPYIMTFLCCLCAPKKSDDDDFENAEKVKETQEKGDKIK